ncbi:MAG: histidine phosphatase family protein [Cyanothece sp. SIO1E1]|nr:histidine phosphatase family protein [Cyanothece sp. SIO1E1]
MTSSPTRIILVRHGRSTYNDQGRYQGSSDDSVLTEQGTATARQVGQCLRHLPIQAVYSSPLRRVTQTTDAIVRELANVSPSVVDHTLREIDLSNWEGLPYQTVREQFAEDYRRWQERPHEFTLISTQSRGCSTAVVEIPHYPVLDLYQRAQQFWQRMLPRHQGQTVLVVSHGGTNHALISTALGLTPEHYHRLQQSNCGISLLEFADQQAQLRQLNDTAPLGKTLPKLKAGKQGLRLLLLPAETEATRLSHSHSLVQRIAAIAPDFCLANDAPLSQRLLQECPNTLQLHTSRPDFLLDWQQLLGQSERSQSGLMTGMAIAPTSSIQTLLMQTLGGSSQQADQLHLESGQFSVIHYPPAHRPVVQAINF